MDGVHFMEIMPMLKVGGQLKTVFEVAVGLELHERYISKAWKSKASKQFNSIHDKDKLSWVGLKTTTLCSQTVPAELYASAAQEAGFYVKRNTINHSVWDTEILCVYRFTRIESVQRAWISTVWRKLIQNTAGGRCSHRITHNWLFWGHAIPRNVNTLWLDFKTFPTYASLYSLPNHYSNVYYNNPISHAWPMVTVKQRENFLTVPIILVQAVTFNRYAKHSWCVWPCVLKCLWHIYPVMCA